MWSVFLPHVRDIPVSNTGLLTECTECGLWCSGGLQGKSEQGLKLGYGCCFHILFSSVFPAHPNIHRYTV
jgi:hypothetical protein